MILHTLVRRLNNRLHQELEVVGSCVSSEIHVESPKIHFDLLKYKTAANAIFRHWHAFQSPETEAN